MIILLKTEVYFNMTQPKLEQLHISIKILALLGSIVLINREPVDQTGDLNEKYRFE